MTVSSGWGGARTPSNPAPVSGPGAYSARTDGGVMDSNAPAYGENLEIQNLKSAAPMAGTAGAPIAPQGQGGLDLSRIVGLSAPSQRADEPVTAGAAAGAGPGPEALGLPTTKVQEDRADARSLPPGLVQALVAQASADNASPSFRRRVREVLVSL